MTERSDPQEIAVQPPPTSVAARLALPLIAAAGVALGAWHPALGPVPADLVGLFGATLCVYAAGLVMAWYPLPWLSRRVEQAFEHLIDWNEGGWYLMVALAAFARAEVTSFLAPRPGSFSVRGALLGWLKDHFTGFSIDSFMNALRASLWPIHSIEHHGVLSTAVFALVVYALYGLGTRFLGEVRLGANESEEEPEADAADGAAGPA